MNTLQQTYIDAYAKLNKEQQRAVDTTEGPVMVVAGPGTGKTQVLALRIATILQKTDTPAHGILCLTFTRAGVTAMRERLRRYIGVRANEIQISTFHSFAQGLIEKHYALLDFDEPPMLLDDQAAVVLIDALLDDGVWNYLRPRGNAGKYFSDIRTLISLLKRERLTAENFLFEIESEISMLTTSPDSISSRGASKGQLKKEVLKKIEALERTREVVLFYEKYEETKRIRGLMDYDDVIEYAVLLAQNSEDVCADIRENILYVHVDEHQDSSGLQNAFLSAIWKEVEQPNIFVVGDDRQLIYGFGGASLSYFEEFKTTFGKATLITLVQNYRSTEPILALADEMQKSVLTDEKLQSNRSEKELVVLAEYQHPRDEIIAAAQYFKKCLADGVPAQELALLVPKNKQVRSAITVLRNQGIPTRSVTNVSLFSLSETAILRRVLGILVNPFASELIAASLFDTVSQVNPMDAHRFLRQVQARNMSLDDMLIAQNSILHWGKKILSWVERKQEMDLAQFVQMVGNELLVAQASTHEKLIRSVEVVRTVAEVLHAYIEKYEKVSLEDFLRYLDKLEQYGQVLGVALIEGTQGVSVMTLHASKGLEFEHVWIAHMNESVLMASKRLGFTLPEKIKMLDEARDEAVARREVYVAITRAKRACTISYAKQSLTGGEESLANVVSQIPDSYFEKKDALQTGAELLAYGPAVYVEQVPVPDADIVQDLLSFSREVYSDIKVSVTLLNTFFECPWRWYFRNILGLPETKTESLYFGSAVHAVLEKSITENKILSKDEIGKRIREVLQKEGVTSENIITRITSDAIPLLLREMGSLLKTLSPVRTIEKSVSYRDSDFPHLSLYGKIDLLEEDGKSISVTDFKTGSTKTSGTLEKRNSEGRLSNYERQLAMYAYLLQGTNKHSIVSSAKLLFVEASDDDKNKIYSLTDFSEVIPLLKKDIADYDRFVQSGEWIHRSCEAPTYGTDDCIYCKRAAEVYNITTNKKV